MTPIQQQYLTIMILFVVFVTVIVYLVAKHLACKSTESKQITAYPVIASKESIKKRKKHDRTKLTQEQYDFIIEQRSQWDSVEEFTSYLNMVFNLNKSRQAYGKVWNGKVDRNSLPSDGRTYSPEF
jgi:hypothetical protein